MGIERRNSLRRAATMKHLLAWLRNATQPVCSVPSDLLPQAAAFRILKHWAIRGLVRRTAAGWTLRPMLVDAPLLRVVTEV